MASTYLPNRRQVFGQIDHNAGKQKYLESGKQSAFLSIRSFLDTVSGPGTFLFSYLRLRIRIVHCPHSGLLRSGRPEGCPQHLICPGLRLIDA